MDHAGLPISGAAAASTPLERQVRARIESLSYLPTTVAVAMKFIELGKNPEVEPSEYAKVISSDSALSSKILSLANSSWFGVRNKVTKPQLAVNLLGIGTVRTLAISYCLTGLHHELRLTPDESRMFWAASLCKAVAARQLVLHRDPRVAEEAFTAGLFQDFALPIMFATARAEVMDLLRDGQLDAPALLQRERALFRLDHAELGRLVAQKLELPEVFVDAVAFHHNRSSLDEMAENAALADAAHVASLFPHLLNCWNRRDALALSHCLSHLQPAPIDPNAFLETVQREFAQIYAYFEQGPGLEKGLPQLLEEATREAAENTTRLVGAIHDLLQQAAHAGQEVHELVQRHTQLEESASHDPLTGALNRECFLSRALEVLTGAVHYGAGFALVYVDLDHFKKLNDTCGHARGDVALVEVVACIRASIRQSDLVARLGGDEFALILSGCAHPDALAIVERILAAVAGLGSGPAVPPEAKVTLSAGFLWVPPRSEVGSLEMLLEQADHLMYEAKRNGGNRLCMATVGQRAA